MGFPYIISIYLHIVCAAFWIGGMLFLPMVLLPGIKNHPDRVSLLYKTGIKFRFYGWFALGILLITGLLNMYYRGIPFRWDIFTQSGYGKLLGIKLILFALMLLLGAIHDFIIGKKAIEEMKTVFTGKVRLFARWSGRLNLLLSLAIAFIGVALSRGGL